MKSVNNKKPEAWTYQFKQFCSALEAQEQSNKRFCAKAFDWTADNNSTFLQF